MVLSLPGLPPRSSIPCRNGAEVYDLQFQGGTLQIVTTEEFYRVELRGASEVVLVGKKGAVTVERVARDAVSAALKQCEL